MKLPRPTATARLAAAAAGLALAACSTTPETYDNHWNVGSLGPRLTYHGLGYNPVLADTYRDHQWQDKQDINLTLRRHFLNNNPDSPFQADDPSRVAPRPPHSLFPDPIGYIHLEGIALGFVVLAQTGVFVPLPVDSLSATFFGGWGEFGEGFSDTFDGELEHEQEPPDLSDFEVKNR